MSCLHSKLCTEFCHFPLYEECLTLFREVGDKRGISDGLLGTGWVAHELGDYEKASAIYEECLAMDRDIGNKPSIARDLCSLGELAYDLHHYEKANSILKESLSLYKDMGDDAGSAETLRCLADVARMQEAYSTARHHYQESLELSSKASARLTTVRALEGMAALLGAMRQPAQAARLFGTAERLREQLGAPHIPANLAEYKANIAKAQSQIDDDTWLAAWQEGRLMTPREATDVNS